jgi:predicted DsbA family dithiol-disulfide isomerase
MKVEIYSDVVCPWCYIGEKRFERALAAFPEPVEVVFRPFQLDPEAPREAIPLTSYLERRFGQRMDAMMEHVSEAAAAEGIRIDWESAQAVNTERAHRLMRLAERKHGVEVQRELADKLFEAHFTLGLDVGDVETLVGLAASVGIDAQGARAHLLSEEAAEATRADLAAARELGVRAVPAFVFEGMYVVEGAQSASTFLQVLEKVHEQLAVAAPSGGEGCEDGACAI